MKRITSMVDRRIPSNSNPLCLRAVGASLAIALLLVLSAVVTSVEAASPASSETSNPTIPRSMQQLARKTFADRCSRCHALFGTGGFKRLTPDYIYSVLRFGQMQEPATGLNDGTLHALAETLGNPEVASHRPLHGGALMCKHGRPKDKNDGAVWRGWDSSPLNTRFVSRNFTKSDLERAKLKWVFVIPDSVSDFWQGAANPVAVAHGRVYFGNIDRWIYALDARTGCADWTFRADGPIRSGAVVDQGTVAFGDERGIVYGLDEKTGQLRWRHRAVQQSFARITGNPVAVDGRLYVPISNLQEVLTIQPGLSCCTSNGGVVAYDIRSGERLWRTLMIDKPLRYEGKLDGIEQFGPSGVGVLASPTVDSAAGVIYATTGNQTTGPFVPESDAVVALNLASGAKEWVRTLAPKQFGGQDIWNAACEPWIDRTRTRCPPQNPGPGEHGDRDFVAPAIVARRPDGHNLVIAGSKEGVVYALDPASGGVIWQLRVGKGSDFGGIVYGMAFDGSTLYVPVTDMDVGQQTSNGALNAVDVATGKLLWRTPVPRDGCKKGQEDCGNGIASPPEVIGNVVIVGSMDGILRGYDKTTGRQFWSFNSARRFVGVNGFRGKGGGFGMAGVAIAGNMMYIASGTGIYGVEGMKGNALFAFQLGRSD